jgi:serpin B
MNPKLVNDVPPNAMALILNAVYFKGAWTHPFNPKRTRNNVPFRQSWSKVKKHVNMMSMEREKFYFGKARLNAGNLRIIELTYGNKQAYSAVVALPVGKATLDDAVANIGNWNIWMRNLSSTPVKVNFLGIAQVQA